LAIGEDEAAALSATDAVAALRTGDLALPEYVEALLQPGALTAAINYYRAMFRSSARAARSRSVDAPVLIIWGQRDRFLGPRLATPDPALVPHARVERLDASHWVQLDQPRRVNALLIEFLKG
jgi:pimeloyl-ACP methyl ester carboxylesterase